MIRGWGVFVYCFAFCLVYLKRIMGGSVIHFEVPSTWDRYQQSWITCVATVRSNAVGCLLTMASILTIQAMIFFTVQFQHNE